MNYKKYNESFKKKLVFNLGYDAGFFSEINNMFLAIVYCLEHGIQFVLYSSNANFKVSKGWRDLFLPFCRETKNPIHSYINKRQLSKNDNTIFFRIIRKLAKMCFGFDFYTDELWLDIRNLNPDKTYSFPCIEGQGNLLYALNQMVNNFYVFNEPTLQSMQVYIKTVPIPDKYIGIHMRAGDKSKEGIVYSPEEYIDFLSKKSALSLSSFFILTDDYRIILSLRAKYPHYQFLTLCDIKELGYDHENFMKKHKYERYNDLLRLLASVELLSKSTECVVSYNSNPGMFVGVKRNGDAIHSIDVPSWRIW